MTFSSDLGSAVDRDLLMRGFHTTATIGCFASGAVAAKLLPIEQASGGKCAVPVRAPECGSSGSSAQWRKREIFPGGKSRAKRGIGRIAGAEKGADGPESVFEGEKGFFKAFPESRATVTPFAGILGRSSASPAFISKNTRPASTSFGAGCTIGNRCQACSIP